jgi:hypothetical protein
MSTIIPARGRRRGTRLGLIALVLAALTAGLAFVTGSPAGALPLCGGNQNVQTAPVTCTNSRTILGTTITVTLTVTANTVTATYTLDPPRTVDTPIRVRSHVGLSSNAQVNEVEGVIPAGVGTGSLTTALACGQIDVKAVFIANGDARGRIAAPYVTNDVNCLAGPTTTAASTTTSATTAPPTGPTTVPPTGPTTVPASVSPTSAGASTTATASSSGALPVTGAGTGLLVVSAVLVLAGIVLVTKGRRGDAVPQ